MKRRIQKLLEILKLKYFRYTIYRRDKNLLKEHSLPKLKKNEWELINKTWPCFKLKESDLIYSKLYKKENSFDPFFVSDYQIQLILKKTNPRVWVEALQHKGLFDIWFPELNTPHIYVRSIAGVIYDNNMNVITLHNAVDKIKGVESFVIKPTIETGSGVGVKKVNTSKLNDKEFKELLVSYKNDYVVQEVVKQHKSIEELNPTSLNTCRVTSVYINGKWGCSTIFKVGKKGADKDNWNSSYLIGVSEDGKLKECGYDNKLNKVYQTDLGHNFSGMQLPEYSKMIAFTKEKHIKYFPHCGIVGWDILVDSDNEVRVIEVNLKSPGVVGEQIASGTFFKEFRDEIISIMSK